VAPDGVDLSMKMMQARGLASLDRSRHSRGAGSHEHLHESDPDIEKNGRPASPPGLREQRLARPVPDGQAAFGSRPPRR